LARLTSTTPYASGVSFTVLLALLATPRPAAAADAQWLANPATGNFGDATNWSGGAVPTGTATFAASTQTAISVAPADTLSIGGVTFATSAAAYSFTQSTGTLTFTGAGVVVNGGSATFNLTGTGPASNGSMSFTGSSSAGSASYVLSSQAGLSFSDTSSAGNATITSNNGQVTFSGSATAGNATITSTAGGVALTGTATAANATITNNSGSLAFLNSSTAGNATVINNLGTTLFGDNATAGNARLIANSGLIDFSADTGPLGDKAVTAGSIEGAGRFALGGNQLTVGSNNLSTTVSGVISDCGASCAYPSTGGSLIKVGTGTLTLAGTNTYTGGTTINGGTLAVTSDASLGAAGGGLTLGGGTLQALSSFSSSRTITLNAGDGTFDTNGNSVQFDGAIGGAGGLVKTGAGTLTLTNSNSYNGNTTINGGTLAISDDSNLGGDGSLVFNGGTLRFLSHLYVGRDITLNAAGGTIDTGSGFSSLGGTLSGAGGLTKIGSGALVIQADSTYYGPTIISEGNLYAGYLNVLSPNSSFTVASGATLDVGGWSQTIGALNGAGVVQNSGEGYATLTLGANGDSGVFSGAITDGLAPLSIVKTGAGTQVLNGQNTYSGTTTIDAGKLVIGDDGHPAASIAGTVTLVGGTLGGIGTVGGIVVGSGAHVAPGNSIGTLNVAGNVSFASGSFYDVDINAAGQSDRIVATGTATLSGATVTVNAPTGSYQTGTRYTILTANGGVTGTFASLAQSFPFMQLALSYDANDVYLNVTRNQASFPSVAVTPNQTTTAAALQSLGSGTLYDAVVQQPSAAGARQAFDALSGEVQASAKTVMIEDSRFVREAAIDRLRAAFDGVGAAPSPMLAYASVDPSAPADERIALWARAFGAWGSASGDGNAAELSRDTGGLFAGGDARVADTWRVGALTGYSHSSFWIGDRSSSGTSDNYHVAVYAGTQWGNLAFRSGAAFTWHDIATSRSVSFAGFGDALKSDRQARTAQVFSELGYRVQAGRLALEPFANAAHVNLSTDGFTESGGAAALAVRGDSTDVTFTTLGLRAARDFAFATGPSLTARGSLGWRHAFGDTTPFASLALVGGSAFSVAGLPIGPDMAVVEAGLDVKLSRTAVLGLSYDGQFDTRLSDQSVKANLSVRF